MRTGSRVRRRSVRVSHSSCGRENICVREKDSVDSGRLRCEFAERSEIRHRDDCRELAGSRPLRFGAAPTGLAIVLMLTQRLRAGLHYAAAPRLGWLSSRRVRFFRRVVEFTEGSFFSAQGAMRSCSSAEGSFFSARAAIQTCPFSGRELRCDRALLRRVRSSRHELQSKHALFLGASCDAVVAFCGDKPTARCCCVVSSESPSR
jgi:hypothetical protein